MSTILFGVREGNASYERRARNAARRHLPWWERQIKRAAERGENSCYNFGPGIFKIFFPLWPRERHDWAYIDELQKLLGPNFYVSVEHYVVPAGGEGELEPATTISWG